MTVTADQLRDSMVELAALEKRVAALCDEPLPHDRIVNFDPGIGATFIAPDLQQQMPAWVNGGPDFWCAGVGCTVWWTGDGARPYKLNDYGNGWGWPSLLHSTDNQQLFNFDWNMQKLDSQRGTISSYLAAPGGFNSLLSYQALGNQETGRVLRFSPWKFARGDVLTFIIKPSGYEWLNAEAVQAASRFTVLMTMYGFRDKGGYTP